MNVLQIIAHPDLTQSSFTGQLAIAFRTGVKSEGHTIQTFNLYDTNDPLSRDQFKDLILKADHINFAWPCLWEMPPALMVEFLQTVFVKDFAFTLQGDRMKPVLDIQVTCLISMGQDKELSTENLSQAMKYCGLHPTFVIFKNVGPRLTPEMASMYLELARHVGTQV